MRKGSCFLTPYLYRGCTFCMDRRFYLNLMCSVCICVQGTGASESLQGEGGLGRNPLDKFVRQMALIREATITPSGMDEELRCLPTT